MKPSQDFLANRKRRWLWIAAVTYLASLLAEVFPPFTGQEPYLGAWQWSWSAVFTSLIAPFYTGLALLILEVSERYPIQAFGPNSNVGNKEQPPARRGVWLTRLLLVLLPTLTSLLLELLPAFFTGGGQQAGPEGITSSVLSPLGWGLFMLLLMFLDDWFEQPNKA